MAFFGCAVAFLGLRYWLLPNIERYHDDIVGAVSRSIGMPVKIGAIEADWLWLHPRLSLTDVRVYDREGREALVLPSLENVLAWESLLAGELRLYTLIIDRPRLTVRRDAAGALYVAGIKLGAARPRAAPPPGSSRSARLRSATGKSNGSTSSAARRRWS